MKYKFRKARLSPKSMNRLVEINQIIKEYQDQGYVLTLRQLYLKIAQSQSVQTKNYAN